MVSTGPSLRVRQRYPTFSQAASIVFGEMAAATSWRRRPRMAMMQIGMGGLRAASRCVLVKPPGCPRAPSAFKCKPSPNPLRGSVGAPGH